MRISDWSSDVCSSDLEKTKRQGHGESNRTSQKGTSSVAAACGEGLSMLAPPPAPLSPFTLCETHGIFELPGCRVRRSSAELEWSSLFLSEQDEAPFSAEVNATNRSEEHTSELQSLMRISYAVFCLKKQKKKKQ